MITFCFAIILIYMFLCFVGIFTDRSSNNVLISPQQESPSKYDNTTHRRLFTNIDSTNEKTDLGKGEDY